MAVAVPASGGIQHDLELRFQESYHLFPLNFGRVIEELIDMFPRVRHEGLVSEDCSELGCKWY